MASEVSILTLPPQLFSASHPFEMYERELRPLLGFEQTRAAQRRPNLPLRFVFGAAPRDTGSSLDPADRGSLALDPAFQVNQLI